MDEGQSRRSLSPYHEKCFPPYCDSAQQVDKATLSKMARGDLEDKYIIFADENLELKKQIRIHERQIQRLQTAIQRQDYLDKRAGKSPTSMVADSNKMAIMEAQNRNLQAKVKVLKQQLINHSFIHCKDSRISESKRQGKSPREGSDFQFPCQTQSAREAKPDKNLDALKMRITELENALETQKNKYKARIAQLEKELSAMEKEAGKSGTSITEQLSETSRQVKDNKELIRLRMQAEKQAAELAELREKLEAADAEIDKLKKELKDAKDRADELENDLTQERNKSRTALTVASKGSSHMEMIRALEEQIRDLRKERDTLKDTNEKLLLLTQAKSDKSLKVPSSYELRKERNTLKDTNEKLLLLTQAKSDKSLKAPSGHELKISQLEQALKERMEELEEKEARIRELGKRPEQAAITCQTPCEAMEDEDSPTKAICNNLKRQLCSALIENKNLQEALAEAQAQKEPSRPPTPVHSNTELNQLRDEVERLRDEVARLRDELEKLRDDKERLERQVRDSNEELGILRPIAAEHECCRKRPPTPQTSSKSIQNPTQSYVSFKEVQPVRSQNSDDVLKKQNQRLEDELSRALQELRELRPIVEEHRHNCVEKVPSQKEIILPEYCKEYVGEMAPAPTYSRSISVRRPPSVHSKTPSIHSKAPSEYISHVTPPPSVHCVETVDLKDPQQRANMLIVSKHDFETVLMQKKRYATEVEMVEPVDGREVLNCKLEICMYDLDLNDSMLEYLSSIQAEPKVYVEWSFVGLDQRTAPLPAHQALFYTNVMYYGPLSSEIKSYLNKVEMPIYLYLVKASGPPVRVAEGTLDMLPAMEQPNRGFMRSIFLQGKDIPSRYNTDKSVGAIHCSFILHECCLGDPPLRDQLEVAIGTLYLKNRDGGRVPDHATHIYIEYALMGHCGPDLETDSVPRGEVMKFNHSKKLRVSDENAPHLKAMLEDQNPRPLRFTVLAEPCNLLSESEVETVGHADINLNEEMIRRNQDLVSSQVPVYSNEGEHLGTLSVTVLGIGTLQQLYADRQR